MRLGPLPLTRIGRLRISVDPALLFALAYLGWWFFERYQALARLGLVTALSVSAWAGVLTGGALAGILLHELGHVAGARLAGGRLSALTISLLGGRMSVTGGRAVEVAAAAGGPVVSLLLGIALLGARSLVGSDDADLPLALLDLARLHLLYGAFNLMPVPPLDGARLLDPRLARRIGVAVAAALIVVALATSTLPLLFAALYLYAGTEAPPAPQAAVSTAPVSTSPLG